MYAFIRNFHWRASAGCPSRTRDTARVLHSTLTSRARAQGERESGADVDRRRSSRGAAGGAAFAAHGGDVRPLRPPSSRRWGSGKTLAQLGRRCTTPRIFLESSTSSKREEGEEGEEGGRHRREELRRCAGGGEDRVAGSRAASSERSVWKASARRGERYAIAGGSRLSVPAPDIVCRFVGSLRFEHARASAPMFGHARCPPRGLGQSGSTRERAARGVHVLVFRVRRGVLCLRDMLDAAVAARAHLALGLGQRRRRDGDGLRGARRGGRRARPPAPR